VFASVGLCAFMARRTLQGMDASGMVQQRHGRIQINPLGDSVMPRLCVPPFVKGITINFMVRLDARYYRNADADTLGWLMYC